ncbi:hypothetical protein DICVIV_05199 [Dictyocaulus viviparus]|uniref:Uncharacterized protein n=1 Tax=Dictyocaulus viviparus TaxID=29172 RepID=A0A0D8XVR3_DICVI|nr:hypothetical protein DICVIV_05199 [Dictyocaulus viviparus]
MYKRIDDFEDFPPTCSSSDDHERVSPRHESTITPQRPLHGEHIRSRDDVIGGSLRDFSPRRKTITIGKTARNVVLSESFERMSVGIASSGLPPRAPIRNTPATASLRTHAFPPPYSNTNKHKPPPYPGRTPSGPSCSTPLPQSFVPQSSSTPKSTNGSPAKEADKQQEQVVAEGERRAFIREKEDRLDKAMSIYENVSQAELIQPFN